LSDGIKCKTTSVLTLHKLKIGDEVIASFPKDYSFEILLFDSENDNSENVFLVSTAIGLVN